MKESPNNAQVSVIRVSPSYWRVLMNNPPLNLMGPQFVLQFRQIMSAIEADEQLRVVVFESALEGVFLNHSDFNGRLEDLTGISQGPTGLEAWPDILVRLPRASVVSIAKIRGRATGNGSELSLACDMTFASREKALFSQWEVGIGMVAGGGPMARLPRLIGRSRALEVLLGSEDINTDLAQEYGYVNQSLLDSELDSDLPGGALLRPAHRSRDDDVVEISAGQHRSIRNPGRAALRVIGKAEAQTGKNSIEVCLL